MLSTGECYRAEPLGLHGLLCMQPFASLPLFPAKEPHLEPDRASILDFQSLKPSQVKPLILQSTQPQIFVIAAESRLIHSYPGCGVVPYLRTKPQPRHLTHSPMDPPLLICFYLNLLRCYQNKPNTDMVVAHISDSTQRDNSLCSAEMSRTRVQQGSVSGVLLFQAQSFSLCPASPEHLREQILICFL